MPYIDQKKRHELDPWISHLAPLVEAPGDLTYVICRLMWKLWQHNMWRASFTTWTMLRSAVEEAVSDFRHHIIEDYEANKMEENGDVYTD